MSLFEGLGVKVSESVVLYRIADLDGVATDFAVFDVGLTVDRRV